MLELFLVMFAVAVRSADETAQAAAPMAVPAIAKPKLDTPKQQAGNAPPAFLAPVETEQQAAEAPPAFLAPEGDGAGAAAPVFLAPDSAAEAEAPPAFLAPAGPKLVAEPQQPTGRFTTATEVKPILAATKANWIAVREFNGQDLVYVTQLWSWRCGLVELRLGVNGAPPEPWPLPPCHEDRQAPNAVLPEDGNPYAAYPLGAVQQVEVRITYDDLSTDGARYDRNGVLIP